jgi:hypothetical protein
VGLFGFSTASLVVFNLLRKGRGFGGMDAQLFAALKLLICKMFHPNWAMAVEFCHSLLIFALSERKVVMDSDSQIVR